MMAIRVLHTTVSLPIMVLRTSFIMPNAFGCVIGFPAFPDVLYPH